MASSNGVSPGEKGLPFAITGSTLRDCIFTVKSMTGPLTYYVERLGSDMDSGSGLRKLRTTGNISISPELFEKLYLEPRDGSGTKNVIQKTVANPSPV